MAVLATIIDSKWRLRDFTATCICPTVTRTNAPALLATNCHETLNAPVCVAFSNPASEEGIVDVQTTPGLAGAPQLRWRSFHVPPWSGSDHAIGTVINLDVKLEKDISYKDIYEALTEFANGSFKDIFILRISHFSKDPLSPSGNPQLAPSLAEQANPPSSATVVAGSSIKLAVICDHWGYAKSVVDSAVHVHGSMSKQLLTRSLEVFP